MENNTSFPDAGVANITRMVQQQILSRLGGQPLTVMEAARMLYHNRNRDYSFNNALSSGFYAPWNSDHVQRGTHGYNCSTFIPYGYIFGQALGIPKITIVQMHNYRYRRSGDKDDSSRFSRAHFGYILDLGENGEYFFDPGEEDKFGPIKERSQHQLTIGRSSFNRSGFTLELDRLVEFTTQEFRALMDRWQTPAGSLDMLVVGQQVRGEKYFEMESNYLMIYYDEGENRLRTRLEVRHLQRSNKGIMCNMDLDRQGEVARTTLDLYLARSANWERLIDPVLLACTDFDSLRKVRRTLGRRVNLKEEDRIHPIWKDLESWRQRKILGIIEGIQEEMGDEALAAMRKQVLVRTIYDGRVAQEDGYLFSEEERDKKLRALFDSTWDISHEINRLVRVIDGHNNDLNPLGVKELRNVKDRYRRKHTKLGKARKELNTLVSLRGHFASHGSPFRRRPYYDRLRDKSLLAKELGKRPVEDLEAEVHDRKFDTRLGHLALMGDFIPVTLWARKELELEGYMAPIPEKVKARLAQRV
jgi:hypothetical protein